MMHGYLIVLRTTHTVWPVRLMKGGHYRLGSNVEVHRASIEKKVTGQTLWDAFETLGLKQQLTRSSGAGQLLVTSVDTIKFLNGRPT